ncbi:unnamed protein product [Anisakis simplex]|uniref:CARD domain-containing protein n=1 Tax=Anisakis simplex TaxID=6269 RepID=A0A0M3JE44_ANISI|nr:unnamed protein product [Anisakis simplex]
MNMKTMDKRVNKRVNPYDCIKVAHKSDWINVLESLATQQIIQNVQTPSGTSRRRCCCGFSGRKFSAREQRKALKEYLDGFGERNAEKFMKSLVKVSVENMRKSTKTALQKYSDTFSALLRDLLEIAIYLHSDGRLEW